MKGKIIGGEGGVEKRKQGGMLKNCMLHCDTRIDQGNAPTQASHHPKAHQLMYVYSCDDDGKQ